MQRSKAIRITRNFLIFLVIAIVGGIFLTIYLNKKLVETIKEQVSEATHGEYTLLMDKLKINLVTHTLSVDNLIIAPSNRKAGSKAQYVFKAKVLRIVDFSILAYLRKDDLIIDKIEFEEPEIAIFQGSERLPKKKGTPAENISLYAAISKKLNSVSIGHIDIMNFKFNIYKHGTDTLSVFSTNDNSISIKNFKVNKEIDLTNRLFYAEKFEMVMNKFSYHPGGGLYTLHGKRLHASYFDSTLTVDSLMLVPNFSKKEFGDEAGQQVSRVNLAFSKMHCQKMDVKLFFEYNWLVIHKVELSDFVIDVFRDNTLPLKPIVRPSLQAMIRNLPFFVAVDTIEMKNGAAVFQVSNPGQAEMGKVNIDKMNISVTGVQNDTTSYTDTSSIKIVFNGYLMNQGKFSESYTFPLNISGNKEFFYCSGSLGPMPLATFNPMIGPAKQLLIKSGQLDALSFSFVARENSSDGTMKFLYHDLQVEVLNKDGEKSGLKEGVLSFLANRIVVKNSNPGKDGVVRISKLHADHNPYRYFLFYSMQTLFSGIAPAIGGENATRMNRKK